MSEHSIEYISPNLIKPRHREWRTHSPQSLELVRASLRARGVVEPPLIDSDNRVVCGALVVEACKQERLNTIPILRVDHLSDEELRLYAIAANRLADLSGYDEELLADELRDLEQLLEHPDFGQLGFDPAELDRILNLTGTQVGLGIDDAPPPDPENCVTSVGELWLLGSHRFLCGDALAATSYVALMAGELARFSLVDLPYNLPADTITKRQFSDFCMAAGELSPAEFTRFQTRAMRHISDHSVDGSLHAFFMSYHFLLELLRAGTIVFGRPKGMCTWVKSQPGQGSLFRSQTEFITYFKKGREKHTNNIKLGRYGRNRTTAWHFDGVNGSSLQSDNLTADHPTPKPVALLREAILDVTNRHEIVLDPFAGSGSIILAAEAVERRAFCMELDPTYVDVALRRCRKTLGIEPVRASDGLTFSELEDRVLTTQEVE
jgi:hypothetical protein